MFVQKMTYGWIHFSIIKRRDNYVAVNQECCFECLYILKGVKHLLNVYDTARCCLTIEILKMLVVAQSLLPPMQGSEAWIKQFGVVFFSGMLRGRGILLSWTKNTWHVEYICAGPFSSQSLTSVLRFSDVLTTCGRRRHREVGVPIPVPEGVCGSSATEWNGGASCARDRHCAGCGVVVQHRQSAGEHQGDNY